MNSCRSFAIPRHHIQLLKKAILTFPTKPQKAAHPSLDHVSPSTDFRQLKLISPRPEVDWFVQRAPAMAASPPHCFPSTWAQFSLC